MTEVLPAMLSALPAAMPPVPMPGRESFPPSRSGIPHEKPSRRLNREAVMRERLKNSDRQRAAGITACWAAQVYRRLARLTPEEPPGMDSVIATLIATRYDLAARAFPKDFAARIRTALGILRNAGSIRGVCHLVVLMLAAEARFADGRFQAKVLYIEVICAELTAAGVPDNYAFGEDLHLCAERLCSAYLPTVRILKLLL